jgi:Flp pilus assembly protein TadD
MIGFRPLPRAPLSAFVIRTAGIFLCICFLLLLYPASLLASDPQWVEVRSEHFSVITDAGEKSGRHVAELFEQMRSAFGVVFVRAKINQPIPLQIIAFHNTSEFRQHSPIFKGKVVEVSGFFQTSNDKDFIVLDMSQQNNWQIVFHEYAHVWLGDNFPSTAPWFDEGFAEYLSTMKVSDGIITVGQPISGAQLLNGGAKFSLLDLFQVQHHSETYNHSGQQRDLFYFESWLVAHYLIDAGLFSQTANYFRLTNQEKVPISAAVQAAFGQSLPDLQKTIWAKWNTGQVYARSYKDEISTTINTSVRPLDAIETRTQLADFHLHTIDYRDKGILEFENILHQNPNVEAAQRGLGYAYLGLRNLNQAESHFRAAAFLGSSDPRVYFYAAELMQQNHAEAAGSEEFVRDLERAIQLDPQYADAYHLLGFGLMRKRQYAGAEQNIRHAVELSPVDETYQLNLAVVLLNEHKTKEGMTLLTALSHSIDADLAHQATQILASAGSVGLGSDDESLDNEATATPVAGAPAESASPKTKGIDLDQRPLAVLTGKIVSVDCSASPAAVLTIFSSGKTYHLRVADREKLLLIHAGKFSCDWKDIKAMASYRDAGDMQGDLVSLELP